MFKKKLEQSSELKSLAGKTWPPYHESSMKVFQQGVVLKAIECFFVETMITTAVFNIAHLFQWYWGFLNMILFRSWDDVVVWISTILREIYLWNLPAVILHRCQGEKVEQAWQEVQEMFWLFWGEGPKVEISKHGLMDTELYHGFIWVHCTDDAANLTTSWTCFRWCFIVYHGKSPSIPTIWDNVFGTFSKHRTCKSKQVYKQLTGTNDDIPSLKLTLAPEGRNPKGKFIWTNHHFEGGLCS